MLGDSDDDAAAWPQRLVHLPHDRQVVVYVFEDIEGADDIKLSFEGDPARIHLEEVRPPQPPRGAAQAGAVDFAAR